jgi:hypothetical protein
MKLVEICFRATYLVVKKLVDYIKHNAELIGLNIYNFISRSLDVMKILKVANWSFENMGEFVYLGISFTRKLKST